MIHELRRRHRLWTSALALLLPLGLILGLLSRTPPAIQEDVPQAVLPALADEGRLVWEREDLWSKAEITTRLRSSASGAAVELAPRVDLRLPDVLVYWSLADSDGSLPDDAHLIGRLDGTRPGRFALPPAAGAGRGRLYLYSLGHQELVDSASLAEQEST